MKPNASATWVGNIKRGKGVLTTGSSALSQSQYFGTGDGEGKGTTPYELVAAALAACFSMTLVKELTSAGCTPHRIATTVTVTMEPLSVGWTITGIQLDVVAEAPGAKQSDFIRAAVNAKINCTISRLLNANISMSAKLRTSENRGTKEVRRHAHRLKLLKPRNKVLVDRLQRDDFPLCS